MFNICTFMIYSDYYLEIKPNILKITVPQSKLYSLPTLLTAAG